MSTPLLRVEDLRVEIDVRDAPRVLPVEGVSFELDRGEIVGLVGESGCGKSMTSLALLGLLPRPGGRIVGGSIVLDGSELVGLPDAAMLPVRGRRIAMIFQEPMTSLNPYLRIGEQLVEAPMRHLGIARSEALRRAEAMLERVGVPDAAMRLRGHAHELSGGLRQRVMIAMALLCEPDLLIADEATTALDVSIQAQILSLLLEIRREQGLGILFISHDLGVIGSVCDRVLVMYAGQIVEAAPTADLFAAPAHPYTRALLGCTPRLDGRPGELATIEGAPPRLDDASAQRLAACRYAPRCPDVIDACRAGMPALDGAGDPHRARRCIRPVEQLS